MKVLPDWNGKVAYSMHRMFMGKDQLAYAMGCSRQYVSRLMWTPNHGDKAKAKVESALESYAREMGIDFAEIWPPEERTRYP